MNNEGYCIDDVVYPSAASAMKLDLLWKDAKKASQMKLEGNQYFKNGKYRFAVECYTAVCGLHMGCLLPSPLYIYILLRQALNFSPPDDEHNYSKVAAKHMNKPPMQINLIIHGNSKN